MNSEEQIKQLKLQIDDLNKKLKYQEKQNIVKDVIVTQQSKMAAMGDMVGNIAHQYRQPLMEISTLLINTEAKIKLLGDISNSDVLEMIEKSNFVLKYMSQTIDDFRNFFTENKPKEDFFISEAISSCVNIIKHSLSNNNIKLNIIIKNNCKLYGVKNEFIQVLINIILNAKDAIVLNSIDDGKITLKLYSKESDCIIEIEDNGGGISCNPIDDIFKSFFTYKKENGTGIGLFISKMIIETNMNGLLTVSNSERGAS